MYAAANMFDSDPGRADLQRADGHGRVSFKQSPTGTRLDALYQRGCAKIRLPKVYDGVPVAVLLNTAGGLTGGDRITHEAVLAPETNAIVTSQTAERAYRSLSGEANVVIDLKVGSGAKLEWLPQETILFDRSGLHRRLDVVLEGNARFLGVESVVLGRTAMGESVNSLEFRDRWRIRRNGRLIFADVVRLSDDPKDYLKGTATGAGGIAFATFIDCCPDAETRIEKARGILDGLAIRAAASAWNGILTARFMASDGRSLRDGLMTFLKTYRSAVLPQVWHC